MEWTAGSFLTPRGLAETRVAVGIRSRCLWRVLLHLVIALFIWLAMALGWGGRG